MSITRRVVWGGLALLLIAIVAAATVFYLRPLAVLAWMERNALRRSGFIKTTIQASTGPMVVWEGGRGPTLVLLHGAGDQAGAWNAVAPSFSGSYRILIPDLPGHGDSAPAQGDLTIGMELSGVEALMETRPSGERVTLIGNSMGAWLAMLYAYRHPERVTRIVLLNGGALRSEHPLSLTPSNREEARKLLQSIRDPFSPAAPNFVVDDVVRTARTGPIGRLSRNAADMEQYLLEGHLQDAKTPTDILWGEADRMLGMNYARRLESELPASRLTLLPRCGHAPTRECPVTLTAKLQDILKQAPPPPR